MRYRFDRVADALTPELEAQLGARPPVENPPSPFVLFALKVLAAVCGALSLSAMTANPIGGLFVAAVLFGLWAFLLYTAREVAATGGTAGTCYNGRRLNPEYLRWENQRDAMLRRLADPSYVAELEAHQQADQEGRHA